MLTARSAGGLFFPQRIALGFDARDVTPELTRAVGQLAAEVRSFERTEITTEKVLRLKVPRSTIRRLVKQVGRELAALEEFDERSDGKEVVVPKVAVVSCDGGRIRTREPGRGRGVTLTGEKGWKETKNAAFEKMTPDPDHQGDEDPCVELPTSFRSAKKVANIAEKPVPDVDAPTVDRPHRVVYQGPHRVLRTAVSSMACSDDFGPMMKREAQRRRLFKAPLRAFLGDGLHWNWSIWKRHFSTFVPILDFIHALQYVYSAAMALRSDDVAGWALYVKHVTLCWTGQVGQVIEELKSACQERGVDLSQKVADDDPFKPVADAVRYLGNNEKRMDYPGYRRLGLPVTSAPMESLIKQMNARVKGTEMFWNDPEGAESILHVRAAALSEDGRLDDYLATRPGYPFLRRSTPTSLCA